ncbi:hypothetical protein IC619_006360 [Hazenella sp. IB182353]|uniref:hypothetical protein n=1 Tax=Polycladospora coralii TaxID=2771432 RepID=UPI00174623BE|nr:hypothetical protein [Polycladospora coralii]MBS7530119.1 hypothetical protein [Polycladospora coralii]
MLFSNPIASYVKLDFHHFHYASELDLNQVIIQLPDEKYSSDELVQLINSSAIRPIGYRMPLSMALGSKPTEAEWKKWFACISPTFNDNHRFIILHGQQVALGSIFEYLDDHASDFNALHDFKTHYVENMITQLSQLQQLAKQYELTLLIENAAIGGMTYFEPGQAFIHPALRTPRHLIQIAEATGVKICFDTAHARITSHVLTYMHRSRSMFAGATEKEILNSTKNWIDFYHQIEDHIGLIQLSYAVSFGDTPTTTHIPFPQERYSEIIDFAECVNPTIPIALHSGTHPQNLKQQLDMIHFLKKS